MYFFPLPFSPFIPLCPQQSPLCTWALGTCQINYANKVTYGECLFLRASGFGPCGISLISREAGDGVTKMSREGAPASVTISQYKPWTRLGWTALDGDAPYVSSHVLSWTAECCSWTPLGEDDWKLVSGLLDCLLKNFFPASLRYNQHRWLHMLKVRILRTDIVKWLPNKIWIPQSPDIDILLFVVRTLKTYSLSHFQVCSRVPLPINATPHVRAPKLTHLVTESLYPLTSISPFPLLSSGNHSSTLILCGLGLFRLYL